MEYSFVIFSFLLLVGTSETANDGDPSSWCQPLSRERFDTITLNFTRTSLSSEETTYMCQQFQVPADKLYNIIAAEPVIDNRRVLHHLDLFACVDDEEKAELQQMGGYQTPETCGMDPACTTMLPIGWAFGQPNMCFDRDEGVPMGKGYYSTIIVQMHYNNPMNVEGMSDASGIRLYYTDRLRPNKIAMLTIGQELLAIPPKTPSVSFVAKAFSSGACSKETLSGNSKFNVSGISFHMHKIGVYGRVTLIRGATNERIDIINSNITYDRPLIKGFENLEISGGDNFEIECRYNSSTRDSWTFWGPATSDEMCYAFMDISPMPGDELSQYIGNTGKYDTCEIDKGQMGKCKGERFLGILENIYEADDANFTDACGGGIAYPVRSCSKKCSNFLRKWKLLNDPCLVEGNGAAFYEASRLWVIPSAEQAIRTASHVGRCHRCAGRNASSCSPVNPQQSKNASGNMQMSKKYLLIIAMYQLFLLI